MVELVTSYSNREVLESHYVYIPNHCCGLIIGRKGQTIKRLEAFSGAKLSFQNKNANFTHTPLKIFGSMAAIHNARVCINNILFANNERYLLLQQSLSMNSPQGNHYLHQFDNIIYEGIHPFPSSLNTNTSYETDLSKFLFHRNYINDFDRFFARMLMTGAYNGIYEVFNNLPNELWYIILSYIPSDSNNAMELLRLRRVSRRWNDIIVNLCRRHDYKVTKKLMKIECISYDSEDFQESILNISEHKCSGGINLMVKDLHKYIRFLNFKGKLVFSESGAMNEYIFECLLQYKKYIQPRTVTFTGRLINKNKRGMLAFLGMIPNIEKLHFQWCEPQTNFFDDNFLIVCPDMKGFLVQQTNRSLRARPRINFTMEGLTQAISLKTDYIFIPFVRNLREGTAQTMMEKYFRLCDGQRKKYMAMISVGHFKRHQINATLDNLGWITRDDNTTLAYQIPRPNLIKRDLPIFFHSVDCTGTLIITTYNNGDRFGRYGAPMLHFNNRSEFTVNEKSMTWNIHSDI
uniref:F-box domain-containing protein n=1 Tax=Strongyloides papillosus TaxID=174720 RepID=A0A0N5BGK0_STREA